MLCITGRMSLSCSRHIPPERRFQLGDRPEVFHTPHTDELLPKVEGATAEDPAVEQVGMSVARLLQREVAPVDGAMALGARAQLL